MLEVLRFLARRKGLEDGGGRLSDMAVGLALGKLELACQLSCKHRAHLANSQSLVDDQLHGLDPGQLVGDCHQMPVQGIEVDVGSKDTEALGLVEVLGGALHDSPTNQVQEHPQRTGSACIELG